MTQQRALAHDDVTTALGYDPQGALTVLDLVVAASDSLAAGWAATSGTVASTSGTLGSGTAALRTKKIGRTVQIQAHVTVGTVGSASGALTVVLPFPAAVDCVLSGVEDVTHKSISVKLTANSTAAVMRFYDGSYPGNTGANLYFHGGYESVS